MSSWAKRGDRKVEISRPAGILSPADGITRSDLIQYYRMVPGQRLPVPGDGRWCGADIRRESAQETSSRSGLRPGFLIRSLGSPWPCNVAAWAMCSATTRPPGSTWLTKPLCTSSAEV